MQPKGGIIGPEGGIISIWPEGCGVINTLSHIKADNAAISDRGNNDFNQANNSHYSPCFYKTRPIIPIIRLVFAKQGQ